jgi:hypothetical protein
MEASMKGSEPGTMPESLRGFWSLFITQFQGAFSDNVLKNLVIFMLAQMIWVIDFSCNLLLGVQLTGMTNDMFNAKITLCVWDEPRSNKDMACQRFNGSFYNDGQPISTSGSSSMFSTKSPASN